MFNYRIKLAKPTELLTISPQSPGGCWETSRPDEGKVNDMNLKTTMIECLDDEPGTIYADWEDGEFRCLIMRGPAAICGYIGVKELNPLYGKDYFDPDVDIDCHGGLTYSAMGNDTFKRPSGYWWFGWDYGHWGDKSFYDYTYHLISGTNSMEWSPEYVYSEFPDVISQFKKLSRNPE